MNQINKIFQKIYNFICLYPATLSVIVVGFVFVILYSTALYHKPGGTGDSIKFQYLGALGGIPHPTGYPLYMFFSQIITYVPVSTLAFRMNAFSTFCAILALLFLHRLFYQITSNALYSFLLTSFVGISSTFWLYACIAEVYALHSFLIILLLSCSRNLSLNPKPNNLYLFIAFLVIGLLHHLLIITIVPAVLYLVYRKWPELPKKSIACGLPIGLGFFIGVHILYYWKTISHPSYIEFPIFDLPTYFQFITGPGTPIYKLLNESILSILKNTLSFYDDVRKEWGTPFFILLNLSLFGLLKHPSLFERFTFIAFLSWLLICSQYKITDINQYYPHGSIIACVYFTSVFARFTQTPTYSHSTSQWMLCLIPTFVIGFSLWYISVPTRLIDYQQSHPEECHRILSQIPKGGYLVPQYYYYEQLLRYYDTDENYPGHVLHFTLTERELSAYFRQERMIQTMGNQVPYNRPLYILMDEQHSWFNTYPTQTLLYAKIFDDKNRLRLAKVTY